MRRHSECINFRDVLDCINWCTTIQLSPNYKYSSVHSLPRVQTHRSEEGIHARCNLYPVLALFFGVYCEGGEAYLLY